MQRRNSIIRFETDDAEQFLAFLNVRLSRCGLTEKNESMMIRTMVNLSVFGGMMLVADDDKDRVLFSFEEKLSAQQWQALNDGVMGGVPMDV